MAYIGHLFIISAASGVGKTSLVRELTKRVANLVSSISYTTRSKRPNEHNGVDYFFISTSEFTDMQHQGEFLESSVVFDNYYGTSKEFVYNLLAKGIDIILEIDWQGAQKIKKKLDSLIKNQDDRGFIECSTIFVLPPSLQDLGDRLKFRGQDSIATIQKRLNSAKQEIKHYIDYDYLIINDNFELAVEDLIAIINSQRLKTIRQKMVNAALIQNLLV